MPHVCRFLRIICIYVLSGIGGFLLSGIFDPTTVSVSQSMRLHRLIIISTIIHVQVGGSGALFGMLGVLVVELLQGWKWVKKPCVELFKLIVMIIIALCKLTKLSHFVFHNKNLMIFCLQCWGLYLTSIISLKLVDSSLVSLHRLSLSRTSLSGNGIERRSFV